MTDIFILIHCLHWEFDDVMVLSPEARRWCADYWRRVR